ncbi:MAG: hypothetical protein Q7S65_05560 [Nanoarchaeota archaeon]|nr:hypothetical protein [Nanoarchaeota archaeon]
MHVEQHLRAALRAFNKHLDLFLKISEEMTSLLPSLSTSGWVPREHARAIKRIHTLMEQKMKVHKRYRKGVAKLANRIGVHVNRNPQDSAPNALLTYLTELQLLLKEAVTLLEEAYEVSHPSLLSTHLLDSLTKERQLVERVDTLSLTYQRAFESLGGESQAHRGLLLHIRRLHPLPNLAHATASALLVIALALSVYTNGPGRQAHGLFLRPAVQVYRNNAWSLLPVRQGVLFPVRTTSNPAFLQVVLPEGQVFVSASDLQLVSGQESPAAPRKY